MSLLRTNEVYEKGQGQFKLQWCQHLIKLICQKSIFILKKLKIRHFCWIILRPVSCLLILLALIVWQHFYIQMEIYIRLPEYTKYKINMQCCQPMFYIIIQFLKKIFHSDSVDWLFHTALFRNKIAFNNFENILANGNFRVIMNSFLISS